MQLTLTAKIKLTPSPEQATLLLSTMRMIKQALNHTSNFAFEHQVDSSLSLHKHLYRVLRETFGLRSQMAQSVLRTVAAKYRSMKSSGVTGTRAVFKKTEYDLVYNRDYTLKRGQFSLNTREGRIKVFFHAAGMARFFDESWRFGTAKLVMKKGKLFLHIPMTQEVDELDERQARNIVGIDLGLNFLATAYDSSGKTTFCCLASVQGNCRESRLYVPDLSEMPDSGQSEPD